MVKLLPGKLNGGIIAQISFWDEKFRLLLVKNGHFYDFISLKTAEENGWTKQNMKTVDLRDMGNLYYGGTIVTVDPARFGPQAFNQ